MSFFSIFYRFSMYDVKLHYDDPSGYFHRPRSLRRQHRPEQPDRSFNGPCDPAITTVILVFLLVGGKLSCMQTHTFSIRYLHVKHPQLHLCDL